MSKLVFFLYVFAVVGGICTGLSHVDILHTFALGIGDIFVRIFKFLSLPVIFLSLTVTCAGFEANKLMKTLWIKTLVSTFGTTVVAATMGCLLYFVIRPGNLNLGSSATLPADNGFLSNSSGDYNQYLQQIVPTNFLGPFLDQNVMAVLLLALAVGMGIRCIPEQKSRDFLLQFFKSLHALYLVLVKWVVHVIPLALYGFITSTVLEFQKGTELKGLGFYLLVILSANLVQFFLILPAWLIWKGISPFQTMKKMMPALSIAFFSKSSAGTLPVTIETAESALKLDSKVSRFVLPLCTSLNMNGCAAFIFVTITYILQNYGTPLTIPSALLWIFISTIAAIGNAGVPMGCFFLSSALLSSMNVPLHMMGLILPFYSVIDMVETALNVWSDSCVAVVVDKSVRAEGARG